MTEALGNHLFTFAVISDSHVNEAEDRSASPFASNRLANGRLRHVVCALNQQAPAFTVHLGDMGNPLPELATYRQAAANFNALVAGLRSPLKLVPGNHCVGDKPTGWVPVPRVSQASLEQYRRTYGRIYYSFDHGPCHFIALNSLLINSGLRLESTQKRWVEKDLEEASDDGKRIWLLMHYPAYVATSEEPGSYDNVDEPGRSWLLDLFERFDVEAVFTGHVHNYFYNRHAGTSLYTVPATSFVRQDYSDLFPIEPDDGEGGRNDLAKLGYCLVEIHEAGHLHHVVRTHGQVLAEGDLDDSTVRPGSALTRMQSRVPLGVEMRENWLSRVALRTNDSTSPFTRRCARNDWAVLALEEMGVRRVRLALRELDAQDVIDRMVALQETGFSFMVYSHGIPTERDYRLIRKHPSLLAGWELILSQDQIRSGLRRLEKTATHVSNDKTLALYLNEVRDAGRAEVDDANVRHEANYGFQPEDREKLAQLFASDQIRRIFDGFVFRLRRRVEPGVSPASPWSAIQEISRMGKETGMRHQVCILFSGRLTAERMVDDVSSANRVAESALAAVVAGNIDLYFDTFEDVDRGYFVRNGLVDRRFNPRLAATVLRHLDAGLAGDLADDVVECRISKSGACRLLTIGLAERFLVLVLPRGPGNLREIDLVGDRVCRNLRMLDLEAGLFSEVPWTAVGAHIQLKTEIIVEKPLLLIGEQGRA